MKQWLKECTHNLFVHPIMMFIPPSWATRLHDKNANWVWKEHYDELKLEGKKAETPDAIQP